MVARLLMHGMIAGVVAGILAFAVASLYGEPQVEWAIAYEERVAAQPAVDHHAVGAPAHDHGGDVAAAGHSHGEGAAVSRETQAGLGLFVAVVAFGASVGGIFALVFAGAYGRLGTLGPRGTAALLAAAGFVAVALLPQLKYPANPPAVGSDETIALRTGMYFLTLAFSIAATGASLALATSLRPRLGAWNAAIAGGAVFLVFAAALFAFTPTIEEVPADFSATVLWNFRLATLAMHAVVWATLGLLLGWLAERDLRAAA